MGRSGEHAVVIGASIAGMCAARVLSDFYDRVTVYERDELPDGPANRSAVPQGRHVHLLMARGAAGVRRALPRSARRHGRRGRADPGEPAGLHPLRRRRSRPRYDAPAARRVHRLRAEPTATGMADPAAGDRRSRTSTSCAPAIAEPTFDAARQRVTGVLLDTGDEIPADLVVDAAGRGTRLPVWLEQWGFDRPPEDSVDVGIGYATHQLRIPDGLIAEKVVVAGASREQPRRARHALLRGRHLGPDDLRRRQGRAAARFRRNVRAGRRNRSPAHRRGDPRRASRSATWPSTSTRPAGGAATTSWSASPSGILPFGDAVASFNPTFGQGMTMTLPAGGPSSPGAGVAGRRPGPRIQRGDREVDVSGVDDERDRRPGTARRLRADAVVVRPGGWAVRPVPRGGRDGSCSRRMVSAPVQPAGQPVHGPVDAAGRPDDTPQHAAVAGRETS